MLLAQALISINVKFEKVGLRTPTVCEQLHNVE